jgi:aminoglycoside phosphotransferase family enzyme/predicted kinase
MNANAPAGGDPLIEGLRANAHWPHAVREIAIAQTHISWIILTGEFAYKIKKPVRFDFLDFSSLELREFYCREELRINRRYAPDLYLDVVPITGTPQHPVVAGTGTPLEFAVRMRQFGEDSLLSTMLKAGDLHPSQVDELAQRVAEFHHCAERFIPSPAETGEEGFGSAEENRLDAMENLDALRDLNGDAGTAIKTLRAWTETSLKGLENFFRERRRQGAVRECHGDLHLGNIIIWNRQVTLFDGVEFNERFRWIDVLSDAAFVAMDLESRGAAAFSHRFANAYLEQTGDYAGLRVWRWYFIYRALVRAKVAMLRAGQSSESGLADQQRRLAANYIQLASRTIHPPAPRLMITHGVSGSGKTFGTQTLVEEQGAFRIRSDVERKRLFGLSAGEHAGSAAEQGIYAPNASVRTYARLREAASEVLAAGHSALVDATFLKQSQRDEFRQLARDRNVEFHILPFAAGRELLQQRIRQRQAQGNDASDADLAILDYQLRTQEPLQPHELAECLELGG